MKIGCRWNAEKISPLSHLRARIYHYVHGPVAHQQLLQLQKFQRETCRQCQVTQKQKNWTPKSAVRACALYSLCVPCVLGPVGHQQILQLQKFQRETWRQGKKWFRNQKIELLNLLLLFVFEIWAFLSHFHCRARSGFLRARKHSKVGGSIFYVFGSVLIL